MKKKSVLSLLLAAALALSLAGCAGKGYCRMERGRNRRLPFHNGGGKSVWNRTDGFAAPPLRRDTGAESVPASAGDAGPDRPAFGKYPDDERGGRRLKNAASGDRRCEK